MSIVKELSDAVCTAGRPRHGLVEANKQGGHQVVSAKVTEKPFAGFGIIMRHA